MNSPTYHSIMVTGIDPISHEIMGAACDIIEARFDAMCLLEEPLSAPDSAYDPERDQYRSDVLLGFLQLLTPDGVEKLVALTELDLYVPGLNFVFGQAELGGRNAVVSVARLRPEFYGQRPDPALFLARVRKEVVHELGHTYGLDHCSNPTCVMSFSNSILEVDRKTSQFCPQCRRKLEARLRRGRYAR